MSSASDCDRNGMIPIDFFSLSLSTTISRKERNWRWRYDRGLNDEKMKSDRLKKLEYNKAKKKTPSKESGGERRARNEVEEEEEEEEEELCLRECL